MTCTTTALDAALKNLNDFDKRDAERLAADPIVMQITMQQRDGRR